MVASYVTDIPVISSLEEMGWNEQLEENFSAFVGPYNAGRVSAAQRTHYDVMLPNRVVSAPISGALKKIRKYPVVGDFVVLLENLKTDSLVIVAILPRRTTLTRGGAGESSGEQILAANIDYAFIITDTGPDFNISRLERYLMIVHTSGAQPVVLLNKADLTDDLSPVWEEISDLNKNLPVFVISALKNTGLSNLQPYLQRGMTVVCIGSSGVGKSTLINALTGSDLQKTSDIRENDGKGKHTTTVRELYPLPSGALIIDTPGLREIRIWTASDSLDEVYGDILMYAKECRFSNCHHLTEPGCAVQKAIVDGELSEEKFKRYQKIAKELAFESDKAEIGLKRFEKKKFMGMRNMARENREWK